MPTWLKVTLILLVTTILLFVAAGIVGYFWVTSKSGDWRADAEKVKTEATSFGRGKDPQACIDEAFTRLQKCDGILCEVQTKVFLTSCVTASNVPQRFCASIPPRDQFIASAQWALADCERRGHANDRACTQLIAGLQEYCERR